MIVREMQPIDLHRIRIAHPGLPGWRDQGAAMLAAGPCWAAVREGQVLALAGLVLHWRGRASCWCLIGADFPASAWVFLTKNVRRRMGDAIRELGLRRVEAEALAGWEPGARWLQLLGFQPEGTMRAYGHDGSSYDRWAKVNDAGSAIGARGAKEPADG